MDPASSGRVGAASMPSGVEHIASIRRRTPGAQSVRLDALGR
jgi:hypothetical protein